MQIELHYKHFTVLLRYILWRNLQLNVNKYSWRKNKCFLYISYIQNQAFTFGSCSLTTSCVPVTHLAFKLLATFASVWIRLFCILNEKCSSSSHHFNPFPGKCQDFMQISCKNITILRKEDEHFLWKSWQKTFVYEFFNLTN